MINLIPSDLRQSIRFARLNTSLFQYGIIAVVVVVLIAGVMLFGFTIARNDENALRESIEQKESSLSELVEAEQTASDLADKIDTVGQLLEREVRFSNVLQEIGGILPAGSVLTSLRLTNDTTEPLRISAIVDSKNKAAVLRQNIEESERFTGADIESIVVNFDLDGNEDGFSVTVIASQVAPDKKAAAPAATPGGNN